MISFWKKILVYIALISSPTVIIDRYSIVVRSNSMHLFIEFLFESQGSLNKRAVQLLSWLRIFCFGKIEAEAGIHAVWGH